MRNTILTAATITLIGFTLIGCDEPAYEGAADRPAYTPEPETQPAPGQQSVGTGVGGSSGSALGGARRAADRTADRASQHQERLRRSIEGEDDD